MLNKKSKYTIIFGCGRLGANLANTLSEENQDVLIIDKNKESFSKLSPSYGGLTIEGNGTDIDILKECQIENANYIVIVTNNDNTNIMIAQMIKEFYKKDNIIVRLYDPERQCVYNELGIKTICPSVLSVIEIDRILSKAS